MAFGFLPVSFLSFIAFSNSNGHIFQVSYSLSIKTGFAPIYFMGFAVAANVNEEHNTSSPDFTPNIIKAKCIAEVPLFSAATE